MKFSNGAYEWTKPFRSSLNKLLSSKHFNKIKTAWESKQLTRLVLRSALNY